MARIRVKFIGYLCSLARTREITVEVEHPANLRSVIENAVNSVGGRLKDYLVDPHTGRLWPPPPIVRVNNKSIAGSYDSVTLQEGDTVSLLSAISG